MKILHVVQGYTPAIGGTERLIQKVSEKLVKQYGDEVTVFTANGYNCELFWRRDQPELPVGTEVINGVTVRRFSVFNRFNELRRLLAGGSYKLGLPFNDWFRAFYNGPLIPSMAREIARTDADVIAASSFPLLHMHYALAGGRRSKKPVVFLGGIHTADDMGFNRPMIYRAIQKADAYIAYTTFEKAFLMEQKGIPGEKISIVGVGVDMEPFLGANGRSIRSRFGWTDQPVVAFIGQQVPHKGLDMLLVAMKQIWQTYPNVCLLIAGARSTYSATVRQEINQLPETLQAQVGIVDNFSEEEKANLFAAGDIVVYPSGHESFGIVFLEAWAAGKPVIGARIGAVPAVIDEGKDGLLIEHRNVDDLIDALQALLSQPDVRRQMGQYGFQKVQEQYTWDIVVEKFRQVYLQAAGK